MRPTGPELEVTSSQLRNAKLVWERDRGAANFLLRQCDEVVEQRRRLEGKKRGLLTDNEQELLRAAIVFAGAGLDAVVKQVLKDAGRQLVTPQFLAGSEGKRFLQRVARKLRGAAGPSESDEVGGAAKEAGVLLARLLMSENPRAEICQEIVEEMTGGSFQSVERLKEVCNLFGLDCGQVVTERKDKLGSALTARNQITHEMDIDLSKRTRKRRQRKLEEAQEHVNTLMETACKFVEAADARLG